MSHPPAAVDHRPGSGRPGFDALHHPGHSPLHRLPAAAKLTGLLGLLLVVVSTPARAWPAFAGYLVLVAVLFAVAKVPVRVIAPRLLIEVPFVVFAVLLPFVATGPRIDVGPVSVSGPGLVAAALLLVKATIGVLVAILLVTTTRSRDLLAGLEQCRLPAPMVAITGFMLRYVEVVLADLRRMRTARRARAFAAGPWRTLRVEAAGVGALFVRSYSRGERVHLAMAARGYTGRMPPLATDRPAPRHWAAAASLPVAALLVLVAGLAVTGW